MKLRSVVQWQEPLAGHCWEWASLVAALLAGDDLEAALQLRRQQPLVHFLEASWVTWPSLSSHRPRKEELVFWTAGRAKLEVPHSGQARITLKGHNHGWDQASPLALKL